jgi:hypothetical protein
MALLFHYVVFQPLWQQPGLIQAGPRLNGGSSSSVQVRDPGVQGLQASLAHAGLPARGVLLHYTDPFLLRAQPLRGLRQWCVRGCWCAVTCTMASVRSMCLSVCRKTLSPRAFSLAKS